MNLFLWWISLIEKKDSLYLTVFILAFNSNHWMHKSVIPVAITLGEVLSIYVCMTSYYRALNQSLFYASLCVKIGACIPRCTTPTFPNTQFCNRNMHMRAPFCYKIMHFGIFVLCILGFARWVYYTARNLQSLEYSSGELEMGTYSETLPAFNMWSLVVIDVLAWRHILTKLRVLIISSKLHTKWEVSVPLIWKL